MTVSVPDHTHKPIALAFRVCCEEVDRALVDGFLELDHVYLELIFPRQKLRPESRVSNVLTGEKYNQEEFSFSYALEFCPFCGQNVNGFDQEFADE